MNQPLVSHIARALTRFVLHPVTLFVIAIITGLVGFAVATAAPEYRERVARVEPLQPVSAAALADSTLGSDVLLEGRISDQMPPVYGPFVAYVREEYRDDSPFDGNNTQRWVEATRVTPPLLVALADGEARVSNNDYVFDTTATTVREAEPTLTKGAVQSRGYAPGDAVLVIGTVVGNGGQRSVAAETLYAGTRAAYLEEYRRLSRTALPIATPFLVVCAVSVIALVWRVRQVMREVVAEQAAEEQMAAQVVAGKRKGKKT